MHKAKITLYVLLGVACILSTVVLIGRLAENPFILHYWGFFLGGSIFLVMASATGIIVKFFRG